MNDLNHFKAKLYNHSLPVNAELWDSLETRLPPVKEDRRFPIFWFILFSSALFGGALMFGLIVKKTESTLSPSAIAPSQPLTFQNLNQTAQSLSATTAPLATIDDIKNEPSILSKKQSLHSREINNKTRITTKGQANLDAESSVSQAINSQEFQTVFNRSSANDNAASSDFLSLCEVAPFQENAHLMTIAIPAPDPNCYKFSGGGGSYALSADFFISPGFSPRNFNQPAGEPTLYAEARNATERNQYSWAVGARINLHLRNGLAARLGILYQQTGDLFDYTDSLARMSSLRIDSFWSSNGTFLYADTVRIFVPGTLIKKIHNTYRQVDIPLLVGYEMPMGRATLMVNAGPVLNLTSSHRGQILDSMLNPRYLTPGAPPPGTLETYKTSLGLSIYIGAGALFPISDHLSALIEPRFLYRIKPVTLDSYPLEEHRHFAGINLGIRYHIN